MHGDAISAEDDQNSQISAFAVGGERSAAAEQPPRQRKLHAQVGLEGEFMADIDNVQPAAYKIPPHWRRIVRDVPDLAARLELSHGLLHKAVAAANKATEIFDQLGKFDYAAAAPHLRLSAASLARSVVVLHNRAIAELPCDTIEQFHFLLLNTPLRLRLLAADVDCLAAVFTADRPATQSTHALVLSDLFGPGSALTAWNRLYWWASDVLQMANEVHGHPPPGRCGPSDGL